MERDIQAIIDLLNSENREDFELGVNIIEALEERPVVNLKELNKDYEYAIIDGRMKRRSVFLKFHPTSNTWRYRYLENENNRTWEED